MLRSSAWCLSVSEVVGVEAIIPDYFTFRQALNPGSWLNQTGIGYQHLISAMLSKRRIWSSQDASPRHWCLFIEVRHQPHLRHNQLVAFRKTRDANSPAEKDHSNCLGTRCYDFSSIQVINAFHLRLPRLIMESPTPYGKRLSRPFVDRPRTCNLSQRS
jgi:hypothetical protein